MNDRIFVLNMVPLRCVVLLAFLYPAAASQIDAARGVIQRILGPAGAPALAAFTLDLIPNDDGKDVFELASSTGSNQIQLSGSSGVALTSGFYYYMRYHCNGSVSWGTNGTGIQLGLLTQTVLPRLPPGGVRVVSNSTWRYMYNFCTLSYSLAFASEAAWSFQVDWMALHGINMPLAAVGTEHVTALTYGDLGLTEEELTDFFPGPAFLGWNRMSDMDGPWSGPLTADWRQRRATLANATYGAMRALGMKPVLMGFGGHVPCQLKRLYPNISLAPRQTWQGFNSSCLLDPADPYFKPLAAKFMSTQRQVFGDWGVGGYYATDQWNEIAPSSYDPAYLKGMSSSVYDAMKAVDPEASWVMQAWFLVSIALCRQGQTGYCGNPWLANATADPPYPRAEAYLSGVPKGKLLLLDLEANAYPVYKYTNQFYGHDFVWCVIHNFGQKPGMYGYLQSLITGPEQAAAAGGSFKGIGLAMEGINNNPVVYELAAEMGWHSARWPVGAVTQWTELYQASRYGGSHSAGELAWHLMTDQSRGGVYTGDFGSGEAVAGVIDGGCNLRFSADSSAPLPAISPPGHNATNEALVWAQLVTAAAAQSVVAGGMSYDLVDTGRQSLDNLVWDASRVLEAVFHRRDAAATRAVADAWVQLVLDLDTLLSTNSDFMLGPWIAAARQTAAGDTEAALLEYNARDQITLWGPKQNPLSDYARKMWGGLVRSYHLNGRWGIPIQAALDAVSSGAQYNSTAVGAAVAVHELAWQTNYSEVFPTKPIAESLEVASKLLAKYATDTEPGGYMRYNNSDTSPSGSTTDVWALLPQSAWTRNTGSLAFLCNVDPGCVGWSTLGMLKSRISSTGVVFDAHHDVVARQGVVLYLKH